jgi:hypothetical protein
MARKLISRGLVAASHRYITPSPKEANSNVPQYPHTNATETTIEFGGFGLGQIVKQSVRVESSHDFLLI